MATMVVKRDKLIDRARRLYAGGMSKSAVARVLGVGTDTLRRWRRYDQERGMPWEGDRRQWRSVSHELVLRTLEERFGRAVLEAEMAGAAGDEEARQEVEGRLLKMLQILNGYRKSADDLTLQLRAMEEFAGFCVNHLSPADLAVVRRVVDRFLEHLRKENL
ncbi:MAG: hypothetical protein QGH74_05195 [Candidatus Brocadiia bacterium]|nr:hypothetical protein [Candidatus Brocadiia bacterium]